MSRKLKIKNKDNEDKGNKDSRIKFTGNIQQIITFNAQFNPNAKTGDNNENKTINKNENKIVKNNISNDNSDNTTTDKNTSFSKQSSIKKNMVEKPQSNIMGIKIIKKKITI